jgi:hypothetical protein
MPMRTPKTCLATKRMSLISYLVSSASAVNALEKSDYYDIEYFYLFFIVENSEKIFYS